VVLLDKELRLREIYQSADLVIPDGISLLIAARLFGRQLKERVPGVDLFQRLCGLAAQHNLRVFLLGGRPGSAELTAAQVASQYPNLHIGSYCPPVGFEHDPAESQRTEDAVRAGRPHLLFVALGAPKQEYWIFNHGRKLGANVCVGVGGTFEMVSGIVPRAPRWIQNVGCEWLYRFCLEPRRMWRRYLIGNVQFCRIVFMQWFRKLILSMFIALLHKQTFAAELLEPSLRRRLGQLASKLSGSSARALE
jgi:N-acetylglucosaminyldiphosphoundecaprenol N-acetyl-beta-D-mannosaminyltransferase